MAGRGRWDAGGGATARPGGRRRREGRSQADAGLQEESGRGFGRLFGELPGHRPDGVAQLFGRHLVEGRVVAVELLGGAQQGVPLGAAPGEIKRVPPGDRRAIGAGRLGRRRCRRRCGSG